MKVEGFQYLAREALRFRKYLITSSSLTVKSVDSAEDMKVKGFQLLTREALRFRKDLIKKQYTALLLP